MNPAHFLPQVSLQRNRIDNAGATALARTLQCGVLPCLEVLDLSSNLIAVDGAIALLEALKRAPDSCARRGAPASSPRVWSLDLGDNRVGDGVLDVLLADAPIALSELRLGGNPVTVAARTRYKKAVCMKHPVASNCHVVFSSGHHVRHTAVLGAS